MLRIIYSFIMGGGNVASIRINSITEEVQSC